MSVAPPAHVGGVLGLAAVRAGDSPILMDASANFVTDGRASPAGFPGGYLHTSSLLPESATWTAEIW